MEGIIALIGIFTMPVFIVGLRQYFKHRNLLVEKQVQLTDGEERRRIAQLEQERKLLEERVQHLETIVCSVDLELNGRLNRLAAQQSRLLLPAPGAPVGDAAARGATMPVAERAATGDLAAGATLLGRFQIERLLGRGGMGAVYLALDKQIGEQVALKVISRNLAEDPTAADRFRREVSAARKVTHPNVIRIHDLGDDEGLLFLSMEYFAGQTLAAILAVRRQLPLGETRGLIAQIARALTAAHAAGVVHRDLKPHNVLVNERGELRVIDFGLAKASYLRGLTATGLILGTPDYMAPEQVRGEAVDHRTDIYALGAMTYHLLSGRPPFQADSPIAVSFLHCTETPVPLRQVLPDLPETVEDAVARALAKNRGERFNTVEEYAARLGA